MESSSQGTRPIMEDSTATTIEFLRARLLAERSVSRAARQRAHELAKRVAELEKQLKFVSLQRKKAERATVDVLAILESHGRSDLSETFDSSSDQEEISSDFKEGKPVETSEHVKVQASDTEGFSGSEFESSSVNGRSLSWKSCKDSSSCFLEKKHVDASRRRRNSFTLTGSSPRYVGKSCRQIRRRERRSVADGSENDDATIAHHEDERRTGSEGGQTSADVVLATSMEELKTLEAKDPPETPTSSGILENHSMTNGHSMRNNGADEDMERALEHHAQFIARYEAEEKAQREWEDKFREHNGSTPDSCDPGTHSDVTEERDEIKVPVPTPAPEPADPTDKLRSETQETDVGAADSDFREEPKTASAVQPSSHIDTESLLDQKSSGMNNGVSGDQNHPPDLQGAARNFSPAQTSGKSDEPILGSRENPDKLGSVLEALQQAKLSLKQNLDNFPLLEGGPSISTYQSVEKFPVPFSSTGLFRLPTDYQYGGATTTRANSLPYDSRLSLINYPTEPSGGQFVSSPYRDPLSRSAASLDDRFHMVPTFPYEETRLGIHTQHPSILDPRLDVGPSVLDPRLDMGVRRSAFDPRFGAGPPAFDPRLGMEPSPVGRRLDMGPSAFDPRLEMGPPFTGNRYTRSADHPMLGAGLPSSSTYGRIPRSRPGADIPL